jgi:bacteriocin-like protein
MDEKELKDEELDQVSGGSGEGGAAEQVGGVVGSDTGAVRNGYNTGAVQPAGTVTEQDGGAAAPGGNARDRYFGRYEPAFSA